MLSILIPTYNYYIYDLVLNIHKKCLKENIVFEIICLDDNSDSNFTEANKKIEALSNCFYKISRENKGRIATREHLAKLAKNKWLLFLDAEHKKFLWHPKVGISTKKVALPLPSLI